MSMSKDECMHDCTCGCESVKGSVAQPVTLHCDLPEGHAMSDQGDHWDPLFGFWSLPR